MLVSILESLDSSLIAQTIRAQRKGERAIRSVITFSYIAVNFERAPWPWPPGTGGESLGLI